MTRDERPSVLLTGFGPFPGVPSNASGVLAGRLAEAARARFPARRFSAETLPAEWRAAPRRLTALLDEARPVLSLHFGVSQAALGFVIETHARNAARPAPDARGAPPRGPRVIENGADSLPATFPADAILANLLAAGLPARLSRDAGAYLCNAVLYHALHRGAARPEMTGFVHIPESLARANSLDWENAIKGGLAILEACLLERVSMGPSRVTVLRSAIWTVTDLKR